MPAANVISGRVYIVEDDDALRVSLHRLLETSGFDVVSFLTADAMLEQLSELPGGCVITDFRMPGASGLELQAELLNRWSDFRVIVVSAVMDTETSVQAMKAGAVSVFDKPVRFDLLESAVKEALESLRTGTYPASHLASMMLAGDSRLGDADALIGGFTPSELSQLQSRRETLSRRESQVAELVFEGNTNSAIGIALGISSRTVEKHRSKVMSKLGVRSVAELARVMSALQDVKHRGKADS